MTLNHEIEIDKKEYQSKPEAKKAAEQALAKHYYENGLEEYKKPQVENAKEETKTEIPDKETMGRSVTDNELDTSNETGKTETGNVEDLQSQQIKVSDANYKDIPSQKIEFKDGVAFVHKDSEGGKDHLFISRVDVADKGKGTGSEFLNKIEDYAKQQGLNEVVTIPETDTSKRFFEKNGYVYNDGILSKDLSQPTETKDTDDNVSEDGGGNGTDGNDSVVHSENPQTVLTHRGG